MATDLENRISRVETTIDNNRDRVDALERMNNIELTEIKVSLARIETKINERNAFTKFILILLSGGTGAGAAGALAKWWPFS